VPKALASLAPTSVPLAPQLHSSTVDLELQRRAAAKELRARQRKFRMGKISAAVGL
jgi:hypothetical protein